MSTSENQKVQKITEFVVMGGALGVCVMAFFMFRLAILGSAEQMGASSAEKIVAGFDTAVISVTLTVAVLTGAFFGIRHLVNKSKKRRNS